MITYLEIDDAELSSMWESEWSEYAANILGIPVQSIAHCTVIQNVMIVTEH